MKCIFNKNLFLSFRTQKEILKPIIVLLFWIFQFQILPVHANDSSLNKSLNDSIASNCSRRLSDHSLLLFKPNENLIPENNLALFKELTKILEHFPTNLFDVPFEDLLLTIDIHLDRTIKFRTQLSEEILRLTRDPKYKSNHAILLKLLSSIQLNENLILKYRELFNKYKHIPVGVLLNKRQSDFPEPEMGNLLRILQDLINKTKGYVSEVRTQLSFNEVISGSDYLSEVLAKILKSHSLLEAQKVLRKYWSPGSRTFEFDFVYRQNNKIYFVEVKNSHGFAKKKQARESKKAELMIKHKIISELLASLQKVTKIKFRIHYIFDGEGVDADFAQELKDLGARVN